MRVAFLGLGIMGRAMAGNLVKAGNEVTVWNRTPGKEVEGAKTAQTARGGSTGRRSSMDVCCRYRCSGASPLRRERR